MDRLVKPDVQTIDVLFIRGQKCVQKFCLTNLMHTMPVAVSLSSSDRSIFSFNLPLSLIPPLSTASFSVFLTHPCDHPPLTTPPNSVLVRSSMLPTGKASMEELRRLFSKPGPHIFKDATLPISFLGHHVAEFLLSPQFRSMESELLFSRAISRCDESQLTSLLRTAVLNGKSRLVSTLIGAGADVNCRTEQSLMALAVESGNCDVIQVLIESGFVIVPKVDRFLHAAAPMDRVDVMEILCLNYVDLDLNTVNSDGQTPLHLAAMYGRVEAIQFLASVCGDVEATDQEGCTALHYAAREGHLDATECLLSHSVFAKYAVNRDGKTAYALAVESGNSHLFDALHLGDSLQRAARMNDMHAMKSCLGQGGDVNGVDQNGWTPLHRAAFKGHLESVELLVSHGSRVDLVDGSGYTPLLRAVEGGHVEVAMYLLSHGAKASLKSLKGVVSCDVECLNMHSSLVKLSISDRTTS